MTAPFLATRLHAGQFDKSGKPYIQHLEAVVEILLRRWPDATQDEIDAAWLHDALEDTDATPASLRAAGISQASIAIIQAVTRPADITYKRWIQDLADSGFLSAIRVKLADNEHNRDPARRILGSDIIERRYEPAKRVLEAAIARGTDHTTK